MNDPSPSVDRALTGGSVAAVLERFLDEHVDLATNTRRCYRSLADVVICRPDVGIGDIPAADLTSGRLVEWRRDMSLAGITSSTARAAWRVLSSALSWEVEAGRLDRNAALGVRDRRTKNSTARRQRDAVRLPTWQDLHELCLAVPSLPDRLMLLTLAWTGARLSEICAIERPALLPTMDLHLTHVWVKPKHRPWVREPLKSGFDRTAPVPAGLWRHLQRHADQSSERTDGGLATVFRPSIPYRRGLGIWTPVLWRDQVMVPANDGRDPVIRTKDLRAYAASALVDVGATTYEAQRLLGHSTPATTRRHYIRAQAAAAHDPARMAIRLDTSLSSRDRLDSLWDAWTDRFGDPLAPATDSSCRHLKAART